MAKSIEGKVNGSLQCGSVDNVHYNPDERFLRLELKYNDKDVDVEGCKGRSYIIKTATYKGDEIDTLLAQLSLPCPRQLLGRQVHFSYANSKYEIRPVE